MNARRAAALALVLATAATLPAEAKTAAKPAPKPVPKRCKIVSDGTNDTFAFRTQNDPPTPQAKKYGPQENGFDITSADIASDGSTVTAVIRVVQLSDAIQTSPQGAGFSFEFQIPSSEMELSLRAVYVKNQAPYYEAAYRDPSVPNGPSTFLGTATGRLDTAKNEVHISAPASLFSSLGAIRKGTNITPFPDTAATAGRAVPVVPGVAGKPIPTRFAFADIAPGGKGIKAGEASCVTPGR